jgi:hypothetical protein
MLTGKTPKAGAGKIPTHVEKRIKQRELLRSSGNTAKSAAHEGVTERPMDKGLSKMLEIARAQRFGRGTSVSRLKKTREEEEEYLRKQQGSSVFRLNEGNDEENEETTSVGRLRIDRLQLTQPKSVPKPKKPTYGDLNA